jgi:hypothetical protein
MPLKTVIVSFILLLNVSLVSSAQDKGYQAQDKGSQTEVKASQTENKDKEGKAEDKTGKKKRVWFQFLQNKKWYTFQGQSDSATTPQESQTPGVQQNPNPYQSDKNTQR